jgi:hypothetical protein
MDAGQFARERRLVDVGGVDACRDDAKPRQQVEAAR